MSLTLDEISRRPLPTEMPTDALVMVAELRLRFGSEKVNEMHDIQVNRCQIRG